MSSAASRTGSCQFYRYSRKESGLTYALHRRRLHAEALRRHRVSEMRSQADLGLKKRRREVQDNEYAQGRLM